LTFIKVAQKSEVPELEYQMLF